VPIRKLPPGTANQIAAGEVVESPSSVVKELVENALDAGAKRIRVILKKGGLQEITVIDDGDGIPSAELRLAVERHATSKIQNIEDLDTVHTLGFRGEALPSIASVSKLSITSRQCREEAGTYLFLEGGREKSFQEVGFPAGTRVIVQDLFFNIPARRKFLKGIAAETAKVSRTMQVLALSRPDVSFILEREKGILFETSGDGQLINVILTLFGHDMERNLIPLHFTEENYCLDGYVSNPLFARSNRSYQFFFVNGRVVRSKTLRESLDKSYSSLVTSKKYPLAFLFLSLPPAEIDVNIHPAKTEIRLYREEFVRSFLIKSLNIAFQTGKRIPVFSWKEEINRAEKGENIQPSGEKAHFQEEIVTYGAKENRYSPSADTPVFTERTDEAFISEKSYEKSPLESGENLTLLTKPLLEEPFFEVIIGQVFGTYILLQKGEDLFFLDQHAAHERILWEKLQQKNNDALLSSQITLPLPFELPMDMAEQLSAKIKILEEIGLELEQFGNNTFIIRKVPIFLKDIFHPEMLQDLFEELTSKPLEKEDFLKEALLQLSCKAAIKANKSLTFKEIRSLLQQLQECRDPFFCPHGRPVFFQMKKAELEKYFKRR